MTDQNDRVRVDKWLWAARFYKTRSLAAAAIEGGKVQVNGERVKRAKVMQVGDDVRVELESVSLSRDVPTLLRPVAAPIVNRIARESMTKTLDALRAFFERN